MHLINVVLVYAISLVNDVSSLQANIYHIEDFNVTLREKESPFKKLRSFEGQRLSGKRPLYFPLPSEETLCERWVVLKTNHAPTQTVLQLAELKEWCVVVVGDTNGPPQFDIPGVTYLSPTAQEKLPYRITSLIPWNHFGRKNIGYIYAIHHGAKVIYDTDDDTLLIPSEGGIPYVDRPQIKPVRFEGDPSFLVHNPYPCLGGSRTIWPRGFPIENVHKISAKCDLARAGGNSSMALRDSRPIGVLHALMDYNPDADAIYTMTSPEGRLPTYFLKPSSLGEEDSIRAVPHASMSPYNAQATLHFEAAFWGMLLPITVHERVSDIWRSFFTQALLPYAGAIAATTHPWLRRVRRNNNDFADFVSELPLYQQSGALVSFLMRHLRGSDQDAKSGVHFPTLIHRIEALAIDMYEHGIIDKTDVLLTQAWLDDLLATGYVLPKPAEKNGQDAPLVPARLETEQNFSEIEQKSHVILAIAVPSIRPDRRRAIRKTWLTWGDSRVVLRFFTESPDIMKDGGKEAATALAIEAEMHGDLVVMDTQPGMNFGLKLLLAMRWMFDKYSFDFFLRLDDDYFLCLKRLLDELSMLHPGVTNPIYSGSLWCKRHRTRMDEAFILLSAELVRRVVRSPDLECGGHGGITAGYWFTEGHVANKDATVNWSHEPRLVLYDEWWQTECGKTECLSAYANVCETYLGVHHAFAKRTHRFWRMIEKMEQFPRTHSSTKLIKKMDYACPAEVELGVSKEGLSHDNVQYCDSFRGDGRVHCGIEGCPTNGAIIDGID